MNKTEYDVPKGEQYGDYDIEEVGYNHDLDILYVVYGEVALNEFWDQLTFDDCDWVDGQAVLNPDGVPVQLLPPKEARETDTPGANDCEALYDSLQSMGVKVDGL